MTCHNPPVRSCRKFVLYILAVMLFMLTGTLNTWATTETVTYDYDNTYQLKLADYGGGTQSAYTYDDAGNRLTTTTYAPSSAISSPANNAFLNGTSITFTGTASSGNGQPVQRVDLSTDGGANWSPASGTSPWSYTWIHPADGVYNIKSRAVDTANNLENPGPGVTVTVDNTPPYNGSITINSGAAVTNSTSVTLTLACDDALSGVNNMQISNDGVFDTVPWENYSTSKAWTLTAGDGPKTIYVRFKDGAGNISGIYSHSITLNSPPNGTIAINSGSAFVNSNNVTLNLSATDPDGVAGMRISNDGVFDTEPWEPYSASKAWALTDGDGPKTVYVKFKDGSGYESNAYSASVTVDTTGPISSIDNTGTGQWNQINSLPGNVQCFALSQDNFAGTPFGLFKYSATNNAWLPLFWVVGNIKSVVVSPNYSTDLIAFAGTFGTGSGVIKTTNSGSTWSPVNTGIYNFNINSLAISPGYLTDQTVFAGTAGGGVFKTLNGGLTWSAVNAGLANFNINYLAISPNYATDQTIFAGAYGGIFKSVSGGSGWTLTGLTIYAVNSIAISPDFANDHTVFACTNAGVYKSTDSGTTWNSANLSNNATCVAISLYYKLDHTVYVGTIGNGVYKSTDGGSSWGSYNTNLGNLNVTAIAMASDNSYIYAGTNSGTYNVQGDQIVKGPSYTITGTANDGTGCGVVKVEVLTDGDTTWRPVNGTTSWSYVWALPPDGVYNVRARATDNLNNVGVESSTKFIVFNNSPTGSIAINSGAGFTNSTSVTLDISATDNDGVSAMQISNDGVFDSEPWENYSTSRAWTLSDGDGLKTVYIRFKDVSGYVSPTYNASVTIDTIAPSGSVVINYGASYTRSTTVTLSLTASDSISGVAQMQLGNDPSFTGSVWENYTTSKVWTLSSGDGKKTVYLQLKDRAGNISTYSSSILLDTAAPMSTITTPDGTTLISGVTYAITGMTNDGTGSGVGMVEIKITNATTSATVVDWVQVSGNDSWSYIWTLPGDGIYTIQSRATDKAGNVETTTIPSVTVTATGKGTLAITTPATAATLSQVTDNPFAVGYTAGDSSHAATLYLFWDKDTSFDNGGTSIAPGNDEGLIATIPVAQGVPVSGSYNWQVIRLAPGTYHVRGLVVDNVTGYSTEAWATGPVTITGGSSGLNSIFVATYGACMGALSGPNDDPDNDGLTNIQEQQYGTNPCVADTDGDGIRDGVEVAKGTDPTNPLDGISSTPDQTLPFYNKGQTPEMYMSKVVVSNYGSTALKSDLLIYDQAGGNYIVSYPVDLPAYGSKEFDLAVDTPTATEKGSIELRSTSTSETGFVKIIRQNATDNTTWDFMSFFNFYPPTYSGTTNQIFYYNTAQIAGNHYQCYLIGRNMTNSAITGTAHMYNMDGSDTGLTANLSGAAHSNIIYSPAWTPGAPAQGVCKIAASGNMTGIATFFKQTETNLNWSDFGSGVDYEFGYNTASVLYGPFENNDVVGGVVTWIIVNNPNAVPVNMLVTYYDQAGNTLGTVTANNILPHANSIFNPAWVTATQNGSFTISTKDTGGNPIGAAGIVAAQHHSSTDINYDLYANGLNLLAQPGKLLTTCDFNKTALWKTLITLLNTSGSSVTATVKFYDRNGGLNASVPVTLNAHGSTTINVATPAYNVTVDTGSVIVQEPTGSVIATLCETHTNPSTCTVNPNIEDAGEGVQFVVVQ